MTLWGNTVQEIVHRQFTDGSITIGSFSVVKYFPTELSASPWYRHQSIKSVIQILKFPLHCILMDEIDIKSESL